MAIYHQDIADIELNSGSIFRNFLKHSIGLGDAAANRFGVRVFRDGDAETLSGVSCQGFFRNANGENIALTSYGTVSGNEAYVTLPQACYTVEGRFTLAIKLVGGGVTGTMRIIDGAVDNTNTGSAVAPTAAVPTYQEILAVYDQMVAAKAGSVRFDTDQTLTAAQMTQARGNIEAASESDVSDLKSAFGDRLGGEITVSMTDGYYVAANDGSLAANSGSSASDYIYVSPGEAYYFDNLYVAGARALVAFSKGVKYETIITNSSETAVEYVVPDGVNAIRGTAKAGQSIGVYHSNVSGKLIQTDKKLNDLIAEKDTFATKLSVDKFADMFPANYYGAGLFRSYPFPDSSFGAIGVKIYTDGKIFITDYAPEAHKNSGGRTLYFSPNGRDANDGLSPETAKASLSSVTQQANDTYILLDGYYDRNFFSTITQSVNIIAEHPGKAIATNSNNNYAYAHVSGNVYSTDRSNVGSVLIKIDDKRYIPCLNVSSLQSSIDTPFSFYQNGNTININTGGVVIPSNETIILNLITNKKRLEITASSGNINVYIEGIVLVGGSYGGLVASNSASYSFTLHCKRCVFIGASSTPNNSYDAVSILGGSAYFTECVAAYSQKDGFNYHAANGVVPYGFEYNCSAYCNGFRGDGQTNNGSTMHEGGKIIRINGVYHDNFGANVADVHTGTRSLNLRCVAYDSQSEQDGHDSDFATEQSDAIMWLDRCKSTGDSDWSVYAYSGTAIHLHMCEYKNTHGGGTIDTEWNPYA